MSRAEVTWPSAGRPFGLTQVDCVMPSRRECLFISSAKASTEPDTPSASTTAMSLADLTIIILSALSTVIWVPTGKPILDGCSASARGDTAINLSSVMRPSLTARSVT